MKLGRFPSMAGAVLLCAGMLGAAAEAAYPERPVRIVVPFAAGATLDLMTRAVAEQLSIELGQQVIVDNKAGASGIIGADATAKAAADGYTVMMAPFSVLAVNASLHKELPYDSLRDYAPVGTAAVAPHVLIASSKAPFQSVREMLAQARARPGSIPYASAGAGSSAHLATEVMAHSAGVRLAHVPYRGTAPAYADLLPGRVLLMVDGIGAALPRIQAGQVRALGVTSAQRVEVLPEVPTLAEAGIPNYEVTPWYGMVAPRGTPEPVVRRLNQALNKALQSEALRKRFAEMGLQPQAGTPEDFGRLLASETRRWGRVVREAGITLE